MLVLAAMAAATAATQPSGALLGNGCVITGGTNFGTITQNCVVNPSPPPIVLLTPQFEVTPRAAGFSHRVIARLATTDDLVLIACGLGVVDVTASPFPAGMLVSPDERREGGCVAKRYPNAQAGKWIFQVITVRADTKFTLRPMIDDSLPFP